MSNALNGQGRVSEETVAAIRAVAARLGYQPNRTARALRMSRSRTFALLIGPPDTYRAPAHLEFYMRLVGAATSRALNAVMKASVTAMAAAISVS